MRDLTQNTPLKEIQQPQKMTQSSGACAELADLKESRRKQERMLAELRQIDSLLIAFSGGADSAYLAWAAHQALGEKSLAVTALSASFSEHDREEAQRFAAAAGVRHECIRTEEFA
ncbi:MAG TPA: hypothetical protein VGR84_06930, partial [Candidatus Acidoferrales bacterium]|nr:hypothetical protein [Candidatus Acidoferrales bacterium]